MTSTSIASGSSLDRLTPHQREITRSLGSAFGAAGEELYLVGGIVRDALLGRQRRLYHLEGTRLVLYFADGALAS